MITYSIVNSEGAVTKGASTIKTGSEQLQDVLENQKSAIYKYDTTLEIVTPIGHHNAIVHSVPNHRWMHSSLLLRVLSFYCVGWAIWMWIFGGTKTFDFYQGINVLLGQPQNENVFYAQIVVIGVASFVSSLRPGYRLIGFTLQALWWLFLTMFFIQKTPSTAIF